MQLFRQKCKVPLFAKRLSFAFKILKNGIVDPRNPDIQNTVIPLVM